jgi:hypothetical protein
MRSNRAYRRTLFIAFVAAAFFVACGGSDEVEVPTKAPSKPAPARKAEKSTPKPAAQQKTKATPPTGTAGEQLRSETALPAYYPDDAPVYPGTKPAQVKLLNDRASLMFGTPDDPDKVAQYLSGALEEQGWQPESQRVGNRVMLQGFKGKRKISVLVSRVDEARESEITMIAVSVDAK